MLKTLQQHFASHSYEKFLVTSLRIGLAIIFVWFGVLKVLGYNPVFDLVYNSAIPWFALDAGLITLGVIEIIIGLLLFSNQFLFLTHGIVFLHLLGTFSTFIFGWHVIFEPNFPILSLDGEFVVKNIILALSGLVVLVYESRSRLKFGTGRM